MSQAPFPARLRWLGGALAVLAVLASLFFAARGWLRSHDYGPLLVEMVHEATGRALTLDGPVRIEPGFRPRLVVTGVALSNAPWGRSPHLLEAARLEVGVRLLPLFRGELAFDEIDVAGLRVWLERERAGRSNWDLGPPGKPPGSRATPRRLSLLRARIEDFQGTLQDEKGGVTRQFAVREARLGTDLASGALLVDLESSFRGAPWKLSGKTSPAGDWFDGKPFRVQLSGETAGLRAGVEGQLGAPLDVADIDVVVDAAGKDLAELGALLGVPLPRAGAFSVRARVTGSRKALDVQDLSATIGDHRFGGHARVEFRAPLSITAVLRATSLELFAGAGAEGQPAADRAPPPGLRPFFGLPQAIQAQVVVDVERLRLGGVGLEAVHAEASLEGGKLILDPMAATYRGTKISAALVTRGDPHPEVSLSLLTQRFDLGSFLKDLGVRDAMDAPMDLAIQLKSAGTSPRELAENLDGTLALVLGKGRLKGHLSVMAGELSRRLTPFWETADAEKAIRCGVAQFTVRKGVATIDVLALDSEVDALTAEGKIDLGASRFDLLLLPRSKQSGLTRVVRRIRVRGPMSDPVVRPDEATLLTTAGRALTTLVLGPAGLLTPFVSLGADREPVCDIRAEKE